MARQIVDYPGTFTATPEARASIAYIEEEVTAWYAGDEISVYDVLNRALSLAGLTMTVDMIENKACIQAA